MVQNKLFNPNWTGVFSCQSWTGGGAHFNPPWYFSPEASEGLVLNMTIVGYTLKNFLRYITFL